MTSGECVFLSVFFSSFAFCLWWLFSPLWYAQKRWIVWYPPSRYGPAMWSGDASYYQAKNYADIFGGTVYRVK